MQTVSFPSQNCDCPSFFLCVLRGEGWETCGEFKRKNDGIEEHNLEMEWLESIISVDVLKMTVKQADAEKHDKHGVIIQ